MKKVRPTARRMIVLHPNSFEKMENGLFRGWSWRDSKHGPQWVWVLSTGPECQYGFKKGDKVLLEDGLVLFEEDLDCWELVKDDPEFSDLAKLHAEKGGRVSTRVMLEGAAIAIDS